MSEFNKYRLKGAFHYHWYETEDWYKYLIDRAVEFCDGLTIDVGCGDGVLLSKLPKVSMGIDSDSDAIMLCEQRGLLVKKYDMDNTDHITIAGGFDYVACINTVEHLNNIDALLGLIRDARKGAIITTIDYQGGTLGEDHKFEWTYDQMMDFFKEFKPKGFRYKDTEWIGVEITK